jgi:hypothetical protein
MALRRSPITNASGELSDLPQLGRARRKRHNNVQKDQTAFDQDIEYLESILALASAWSARVKLIVPPRPPRHNPHHAQTLSRLTLCS